MELTTDQIWLVLGWAAAADFEAKLDAEDVALVKTLCAKVGASPEDYAPVFYSQAH